MLSPSDIVVRPTNLTERLAATGSAEAPALSEPTPTTMAERFAPEAQKIHAEDSGRPPVEPEFMPGLIAERARASSAGKWFLIAAILVSLVPTAIVLALLWNGVITIPRSDDARQSAAPEPLAASEPAAAAAVTAIDAAPKPEPEPVTSEPAKPEIALTVPGQIEAKSGEEVAFTIAIDSSDTLPPRSVIAIRAIPEGVTFSQGRPYGTAEWNLTPDEIADLTLKTPQQASGSADMRVELMAPDGAVLASATTRLAIAPDPKAALILRSDESDRIADLIAHGQKMIDVGYLAGARAYFRRAAEAGSGDAALLLGATFDPEFIDKIGAHGIKADLQEARGWYERAEQLGVEDAETKLKALKEDMTSRQHPIQATEAVPKPPPLAATEPAKTAEAHPVEPAVNETESPVTADSPTPVTGDEWVALISYANVRAAPSSNADTIRVAEKGVKLRLTARQGNWVQVTDPVTAEVGWVYARYIETAEAPAH